MVTKAMIMSAGVGSRLDPLTRNIPKPLVPIANIPSMDILLKHLKNNGIDEVIANTHYLASQIHDRYVNTSNLDIKFDHVYEKELSGTAGGVKKCQFFFEKGEDFLVMSADGVTNVNIREAINCHKKSKCIATMIIKAVPNCEVKKFGVVVTDSNGFIEEFQEKPDCKEAKSNLVNTGIYVFNYNIFDYIPKGKKYDFAKDVFPDLLSKNININTYTTDEYWCDIGSIEQYVKSVNDVFNNKLEINGTKIIKKENGNLIIGKNTDLANSVEIVGNCVIGNNCKIGSNSKIKYSIIWDNVEIADNIEVENCVIASNSKIFTPISNKIIEANSNI